MQPVSYTHLDVYKRQQEYPAPEFSSFQFARTFFQYGLEFLWLSISAEAIGLSLIHI